MFDRATSIGVIADALAEAPGAIAVVVDSSHVLCGIVTAADANASDRSTRADAVMSVRTLAMEPENDVEAAIVAVRAHDVDHVLVVASGGALLGVLSRDHLRRARRRAA